MIMEGMEGEDDDELLLRSGRYVGRSKFGLWINFYSFPVSYTHLTLPTSDLV